VVVVVGERRAVFGRRWWRDLDRGRDLGSGL
jgi:hypothetical protein